MLAVMVTATLPRESSSAHGLVHVRPSGPAIDAPLGAVVIRIATGAGMIGAGSGTAMTIAGCTGSGVGAWATGACAAGVGSGSLGPRKNASAAAPRPAAITVPAINP